MNARAIVGLVAAALVVILAAIPVLSEFSEFTELDDNENISTRFSVYKGETLELVFGDDLAITVNGVSQDTFAFYSSTFLITKTSSTIYFNDWVNEVSVSIASGDTLTISDYDVSGTGGLAAVDANVIKGQAIYADPEGDYAKFSGDSFFMDKNSVFFVTAGTAPAIFAKGTLNDLEVLQSKGYAGSFADFTITDIDVTYAPVDGANGTVQVSGVSYLANGEARTNASVLAPIAYHAPSDGGTTGLLVDLVPLFLSIALLLGAVAIVLRRS